MIKYILYVSTAADHCGDDDVRDILDVSRKNNSKNSVTGMLVSKNRDFLQYLEGPEKQVSVLFDKIERDNRHREIEVIDQGKIEDRVFFDWEMGFANEKHLQPLQWKWQLDKISLLSLAEDAENALLFIKEFMSTPNLENNSPLSEPGQKGVFALT